MIKLISKKHADKILEQYDGWIREVSEKYSIPAAIIQAVLFKEMTEIDILDPAADLAAELGVMGKHDSSIGYAQIFGAVGIKAANFAVAHGMASYRSLGIISDHVLDPEKVKDVRQMWHLLHSNMRANIEMASLNLVAAAEEMTGHTDFAGMTDEEIKLTLTRYNADVKHITKYGEEVFELYKTYKSKNSKTGDGSLSLPGI